MNYIKSKQNLLDVLTISFFTSSTLLFFIPSLIFLTNTKSFTLKYIEMALFLSLITVTSFIAVFLILFLLLMYKEKVFKILLSILFILGFLFWFQANLLVWNYGVFDGKPIIWEKYALQTYIDSIIWLVLILFAAFKYKVILKISKRVGLLLIILQLIYTGVLFFQRPETPAIKEFYLDETNKFNFSKDKNIIYLILDTLQADIFQEIISENDKNAKILDGFTFYPDTVSAYNRTDLAIPSLLTETEFHDESTIQEWTRKSFQNCSLLEILRSNSFNIEVYTEYPAFVYFKKNQVVNYLPKTIFQLNKKDLSQPLKLADLGLFRSLPTPLKKYIYNNQLWRIQNLIKPPDRNLNTIAFAKKLQQEIKTTSTTNRYKFYHLFGAHPPYSINRNLEYITPKNIIDFEKDASGYKEQSRGMLHLIEIFINKLKEENVYDNSLIVIMGDHGVGYYGSEKANSLDLSSQENINITDNFVPKLIKERANPALLIKPFKARGGLKLDSKRAHLIDLSTTVLSTQGLKSCSSLGINLLDPTVDTSKRVRINNFFPDIYTVDGDVRDWTSWRTGTIRWLDGEKKEISTIPNYKFGNTINSNDLIFIEKNLVSYRFNTESQVDNDIQLEFLLSPFKKQKLNIYINNEKVTQIEIKDKSSAKTRIPKELFLKGVNILTFGWPENNFNWQDLTFDYLKLDEIK